jgi:hypothetical protein
MNCWYISSGSAAAVAATAAADEDDYVAGEGLRIYDSTQAQKNCNNIIVIISTARILYGFVNFVFGVECFLLNSRCSGVFDGKSNVIDAPI